MAKPGEHKTVQARILEYAQEIGWTYLSRAEAEQLRGFAENQQNSPYFSNLLYEKAREFNPHYTETKQELLKNLQNISPDIYGNRELLKYLRNESQYYYQGEKRELDLKLIDYDDLNQNIYHVTEEFVFNNSKYGNREDVVFLINGIPILVIECKNATKDEAIPLGIDQIRRYHTEIPELFIPQMLYTATEAIGFSYGVTWNLVRRNIFHWKHEQIGNLEAKIKSFCQPEFLLKVLKNFIIFVEKDETLQKFILKQHQTTAVEKVIQRCHHPAKTRGLVWHTQGSGKTFTMIKAAEMLFKAPQSNKPTIILMIDRNELEDQMMRNLNSLGLNNVQHATSISKLIELLENDYRGVIVTMIHKFRGMKPDLSDRSNIYVLIDEAHRTTGGDLGTYLMAALPQASYIGFTGTPIDNTGKGKGTFKTFGIDDQTAGKSRGYLDKYSINDSITDKTTLPLFYNIAPNEIIVPADILEAEFWGIADTEGISDIEELNAILDRAVQTKNFLKADQRIDKIAQYVAKHYTENIEPLGYKAFLVAVDRPACAKYKEALDRYLPSNYSQVVYTRNHNDSQQLKQYHLDKKAEKALRKNFPKFGEYPKILIVTQKLLTGFDAPILYAMYLDKPMRDHTLLQALTRVNRPYENEQQNMVKPHGFVLDFVGLFSNLEKALSFDSEEINATLQDIELLKTTFRTKMEESALTYLELIQFNFNDIDVDNIIKYFRDTDSRKTFQKFYQAIEMLYEVISPDPFLADYIEDYQALAAINTIIRKAYTKRTYIDRETVRKTDQLLQKYIDVTAIGNVTEFVEINAQTLEVIQSQDSGDSIKVINLLKNINRAVEATEDDPLLIAMAERTQRIQENFAKRKIATQEALNLITSEYEEYLRQKTEQSAQGYDNFTYFIEQKLKEAAIPNPETITEPLKKAFTDYPHWKDSEEDLRQLRQAVTFAIFSIENNLETVTHLVDQIFKILTSEG